MQTKKAKKYNDRTGWPTVILCSFTGGLMFAALFYVAMRLK